MQTSCSQETILYQNHMTTQCVKKRKDLQQAKQVSSQIPKHIYTGMNLIT